MEVAQASRLWAITHDFHIMWAHRRDAGVAVRMAQLNGIGLSSLLKSCSLGGRGSCRAAFSSIRGSAGASLSHSSTGC